MDGRDQYTTTPALCGECGHMGQCRRCHNCFKGPYCAKCIEEHALFHCAEPDNFEPGT